MKVTIESMDNFHKAVIESQSVTADEVLQDCIYAMLGSGFHWNSVVDAVRTRAEEYGEAV